MALTPRLDLRQTQSLVMTPQLQQAIKLLQLSTIELSAYVETQLEQNPLLERDETTEAFEVSPQAAETEPSPAFTGSDPPSVDAAVSADAGNFADADLDFECYDNLFDSGGFGEDSGSADPFGAGTWQNRGGSFEESDTSPEDLLTGRSSLRDHLTSQLAIELENPTDRLIGAYLIDNLDEAGYLACVLDSAAEMLGCPLAHVERTLARLQSFDPTGIFARSLAECLALQLAERDRLSEPMARLLENLELVGRRDWTALSRLCGVGFEQLGALVAELRTLNPKPALSFDYDVAPAVTPDVIMRSQPGTGWIVELNSETLPRVLVNNQYYSQISRSMRNREDKQFINECLQSANWLVKSLHQRATTILKVATEIVRQQQGFFVNGVHALRPLVLRDIADAIGMHESTVSRVTSNKFISTPRGIYELKYFFTHAIAGANGGDAHSAESVRHRIKTLIDAEPAQAVLSDDALAEVLQKEGIDIARRTVAKYREAMRIPSSVQRRRRKSETL